MRKFKLLMIGLLLFMMIAYIVQSLMYQTFNPMMSTLLFAGCVIVLVQMRKSLTHTHD
ncbi:hypothetical protein [Saccharibacillus endophyticus]|uniref:Uncharacterized protein n=1 Tax=Saccharibacillus endophyticus TaxID=2060666 RepID=A0ABQ2A1Z3_9BACL|nr:hypothetical protein [Saccharibacillus endophyticus]GGH82388.1 hypothetical protein GCM10007362_33630 [Saccharibacillus endophyticus]